MDDNFDQLYKEVNDLTSEAFYYQLLGDKGYSLAKFIKAFYISEKLIKVSKSEPEKSMSMQSAMWLSKDADKLEEGKILARELISSTKYNDIKRSAEQFLEIN